LVKPPAEFTSPLLVIRMRIGIINAIVLPLLAGLLSWVSAHGL
jgi:hypothetical protein